MERFVAAINARELDALEALMSDDFTYIDSWREGVNGRDKIMSALRIMLGNDPDFAIAIDSMNWRDPHVLVTGRVSSRQFGPNRRAVWQVLVREGKVAEYQAWAEGGPRPLSKTVAPRDVRKLSDRASDKPLLQ